MNDLLNGRLFGLLSEQLPITNNELQNAYEELIEKVTAYYQSENDYTTIIRTLNFTRVEFKALQTLSQHGQGEKCSQKCIYY